MDGYGDPQPAMGPALTPLQVIAALRWAGDLRDDEVVRAIKTAADADIHSYWPELDRGEIALMRDLCGSMTRSRLRVWKAARPGGRGPTWLEVRGLVFGLHAIFEEAPPERGKVATRDAG